MASFGRLLGRRRGALAAALVIAAYTLLAGGDPVVVRAAVLVGLALLARQLGRRQHGLNSLAFVAGDRDGLPSPETLSALHGWIEITTDGENTWVEVERK